MSTPHLTVQEKTLLNNQYRQFNEKANRVALTAFIAGFFVLTSLVVIVSSCLCLSLPGVNVIRHVILPGVLPGTLGVLQSIPFIYLAAKANPEKNKWRKTHTEAIQNYVKTYKIRSLTEEKAGKFIYKELMPKETSKEYRMKLIGDIQKIYKKDTPLHKAYGKAQKLVAEEKPVAKPHKK